MDYVILIPLLTHRGIVSPFRDTFAVSSTHDQKGINVLNNFIPLSISYIMLVMGKSHSTSANHYALQISNAMKTKDCLKMQIGNFSVKPFDHLYFD